MGELYAFLVFLNQRDRCVLNGNTLDTVVWLVLLVYSGDEFAGEEERCREFLVSVSHCSIDGLPMGELVWGRGCCTSFE
jgi:hypothetical protein